MSNLSKLIILFFYLIISSTVSAQIFPPKFDLKKELDFRKGKFYKEEKYYFNDLLDSIYRKWDSKGEQVTEGYYHKGKKDGKWTEWFTHTYPYHYLTYTYKKNKLQKVYEYIGDGRNRQAPKGIERYYTLDSNTKNYTMQEIKWGKQKKEKEATTIIKNGIMVLWKKKLWEDGIPWKEEEERVQFDKNGKNLGLKKHGIWRSWNKDGTLQKETWYNMGKKLKEKLYDHGKLTSDKKY